MLYSPTRGEISIGNRSLAHLTHSVLHFRTEAAHDLVCHFNLFLVIFLVFNKMFSSVQLFTQLLETRSSFESRNSFFSINLNYSNNFWKLCFLFEKKKSSGNGELGDRGGLQASEDPGSDPVFCPLCFSRWGEKHLSFVGCSRHLSLVCSSYLLLLLVVLSLNLAYILSCW